MATELRNVRVDGELWAGALLAAEEDGTNVSAVIREFLATYVAEHEATINKTGSNA